MALNTPTSACCCWRIRFQVLPVRLECCANAQQSYLPVAGWQITAMNQVVTPQKPAHFCSGIAAAGNSHGMPPMNLFAAEE